jgi:hypothetical protein
MMRLGRRASLLVALSLLASAATARAECAWVLWSEIEVYSSGQMKSGGTSTPDSAFETKAECEKALLTSWQSTRDRVEAGGGTKFHPDQSRSEAWSNPGFVSSRRTSAEGKLLQETTFRFKCWPDTIDPRGPKWK